MAVFLKADLGTCLHTVASAGLRLLIRAQLGAYSQQLRASKLHARYSAALHHWCIQKPRINILTMYAGCLTSIFTVFFTFSVDSCSFPFFSMYLLSLSQSPPHSPPTRLLLSLDLQTNLNALSKRTTIFMASGSAPVSMHRSSPCGRKLFPLLRSASPT